MNSNKEGFYAKISACSAELPLFTGLTDDEILSILHCVSAAKITRPRGSYIFRAGDSTEVMGLMLSGSTLVIQEDLWGHRNILSKCNTGDFFGEPYAATPGAILNISVVAEEDCEILLLNVKRLLTSCPTACDHSPETHPQIWSAFWQTKYCFLTIRSPMYSKRTTREKLLSYLSAESIRQSSLPLTSPLTVSSWRIFSAWSVPPCRWSFPSRERTSTWQGMSVCRIWRSGSAI